MFETDKYDLIRLTPKFYTSLNENATNVKSVYGYIDWTSADYPDRTTGQVNSINYTYTSGELALSDRYYQYDGNRNITEVRSGTTSSGSLREKYTYDALNRLTRRDSALQNKPYTYSYDDAGNLQKKRTYAYTTGTLGEVQDTVTYQYSRCPVSSFSWAQEPTFRFTLIPSGSSSIAKATEWV